MELKIGFEGSFPEKHTCDGEDVSPGVVFHEVPESAETVALVLDDPDAPGQIFTHWVIWNIPVDGEIPEQVSQRKETSFGASQGVNDFGEFGYRGPCPPSGTHTYRFRAYALDSALELKCGIGVKQLEEVMEGHVLEEAVVERDYSE